MADYNIPLAQKELYDAYVAKKMIKFGSPR